MPHVAPDFDEDATRPEHFGTAGMLSGDFVPQEESDHDAILDCDGDVDVET